jgi:hypothetical protein
MFQSLKDITGSPEEFQRVSYVFKFYNKRILEKSETIFGESCGTVVEIIWAVWNRAGQSQLSRNCAGFYSDLHTFCRMSLKMWCPFRCRQTISELGLLIFCALLSITGQRNCSCSHNSIISTLKTECEADLSRDSNPTIRSKYPEEGNC